MAVYHKINQACTNEAELIGLIRTVLTDANVGMVESDLTTGCDDEILLKTKNAHNGDYGYLHFISKEGTPNYLELHAYPPGHEAFDSPDSFDAPDTDYLPGPDGNGGTYDVNEDYYSAAGILTRADYTFTVTVDIFSDGDMFIIYLGGGTAKYLVGVLQRDRQLGFGWFQYATGNIASGAIRNGSTIRKTATYIYFTSVVKASTWGGVTSALSIAFDTSPSDFIKQGAVVDIEVDYRERMDIDNIFNCTDGASRGHEFSYGSVTYYVIVPGSETSHDNGVVVVKGTVIA